MNKIKEILSYYAAESTAVKAQLYRILTHGLLGGTGRLLILPVDQGFEHGPARSFAKNNVSYNPRYHFKLAIESGFSAYAAPLGFLQAAGDEFAGQIPTILKLNSSNSLTPRSSGADQAITASVKDALLLGCNAIGLTIYPGSDRSLDMIEEAKELIREAKSYGLATVVWSYPRGGELSKEGETAIDICAYAAHIAALLGANIIKVKLPTDYLENPEAKKVYETEGIPIASLKDRIAHIVQCCFNGQRLVVFSGGAAKTTDELLTEVKAIHTAGGNGSIIGRNSFQRPYIEAQQLVKNICDIYKS